MLAASSGSGGATPRVYLWQVGDSTPSDATTATECPDPVALPTTATAVQLCFVTSTVLAGCKSDGSISLWDCGDDSAPPRVIAGAHTYRGKPSVVNGVCAISPATVASCGDDGATCVWDIRTPAPSPSARFGPPAPTAGGKAGKDDGCVPVTGVAAVASGDLVSVDVAGRLAVWDVRRGSGAAARLQLDAHAGAVSGVAVYGSCAATFGADNVVRLWDVASVAQQRFVRAYGLATHPGGAVLLRPAFSPSGRFLACATSGSPPCVPIYATLSGEIARRLPGHVETVAAVAFYGAGLGAGTVVATGGYDKQVFVDELVDIA